MPGDKSKQMAPTVSDPVTASQPAFLQGTSPAMMDAFMPGQRVALAEQLALAFGQPSAAWGKSLDQTYQPAKTLDFTKAGAATKAGLGATPGVTKPVDKFMGMGPLAYTRMTSKG